MAFSEKTRNILAAVSVPARIYIGVVFILASLYKIYEPYAFGLSVATYQIAPLSLINIFTLMLPWMELIVGITLVLGFWTRESAFLISAMMIMFLVSLTIALNRDLQISCGCFASQETADEISIATIFRDLAWLSLALYAFIFDDGRFGLDGLIRRKISHA